ncbi:MAG: AMP-binding protein, partial [Clostridia bacterium]|nr:AMP-binding protein [Clostridia bacterium]
MKIVFSTKNVNRASFLDTCRYAYDYGFEGFEIYDAIKERSAHNDSILRRDRIADAKRKLVNRNLAVSALRMPESIDNEKVTSDTVLKYVDMAGVSGIANVIVRIDNKILFDVLDEKLSDAIKKAENTDVNILFETVGALENTENVIDIINHFSSAVIGASWNVRGTYFGAGETSEATIKTLGAYIKYVRLGDMKDDKTVLIGEGELDVAKLINALSSLNYEGYICAAWNEEINDADIVLTHFANYISQLNREKKSFDKVYYNRDKTGTFVWKKYDVIDATFSDVLDTMAEKYPDQYAFKYPTLDYTRTYEQFRRDVDECAAALISLGVKAGDHVAVWATNVPEWFITFWATTKIGAVLVTVNTAYKIHEIEYLLKQSDTHTLVMIEYCKDINYKGIIQELCPELENLEPGKPLYSKNLPFLRNVVTVGFSMPGCLTWNDMLSRSASVPREEVRRRASLVKPDDVCNMQYTSGTTGFPKGVMLTHRNIVNNGKTIGDRMDLSTADRKMIQVPMFHCFGMVLSMTSMMTHGGTLCPIPYFSPKSSLACVNDEKITCFNGVPTMFIAMFNHADFAKTDFSYMRTGIMAGANCPADLMRRASIEMNMREIISVYGQTEAAPGCTMGEVNEDLDHRVETVGSAFPGVECKIIDPETGEELPDGESGEFVARGFNIMKGYYKMPEATAQAIDAEGWLHSGDICMRTPDGYYKVTGRLKDMIIRGGENLYP